MEPLSQPIEWHVLRSTCPGENHRRKGIVNQDKSYSLPFNRDPQKNSPYVVLAVSDGHGDSISFRSSTGAYYAARIACELGYELIQSCEGNQQYSLSMIKGAIEQDLPVRISREWRKRIDNHLKVYPITPENQGLIYLQQSGEDQKIERLKRNSYLAYGATLLIAIVTEKFIAYLQIGDGDITVVSEDGEITRPIPGDSRLIANETTSLCFEKAQNDFRVKFQPLKYPLIAPALILLSTDGYANSFASETEFLKVGADLYSMLTPDFDKGFQQINRNVRDWLKDASREGSGDDITLGMICRPFTAGDILG